MTITYSIVEDGWSGTGNLNADPLFVNAPAGNLRLQNCSPAINAGDDTAVPAGITTDLDGNPRFYNSGTVDMGAYEYQDIPNLCLCTDLRTWTGALDTDWNTGGNWNPACVPTADNPVIIPDATNDPRIGSTVTATAKSVWVQPGGVLTLDDGGSLDIEGFAPGLPASNGSAFALLNEGTLQNAGTLRLNGTAPSNKPGPEQGRSAPPNPYGLYNTGPYVNDLCATLTLNAPLFNNAAFTNKGLISANTAGAHSNTGLTNDGLIVYPQGNPIPNVTNNSIIIAPLTSNNCAVISPAFELGNAPMLSVSGIYTDANASQPAGNYDKDTNTFTPDPELAEGTYDLVVVVGSDACDFIVPWQLTTSDCCEPPTANCKPHSVELDANGQATIDPADVDFGSAYDCGLQGLAVAPNQFACANLGPNTVTLTVSDSRGQTATCTATVTVQNPLAVFNVSAGNFCPGETGAPVGLSGSETGVQYQLRRNSIPQGAPQPGTGAALDFGEQPAGSYSVVATSDVCGNTALMNGPASVAQVACGIAAPGHCACDAPDGRASATVAVSAPAGQNWTVKAVVGLYDPGSPPAPAAPTPLAVGTPLQYSGNNTYTLEALRLTSTGYWVQLTNGSTDFDLMVGNASW